MGLLDLVTLQGSARKAAPPLPRPDPPRWDTKAAPPADALVPVGVQGRPQYPDTDIPSLQRAYLRNPLVYACIAIRASAAQAPTLVVERQTGPNTWAALPDHPLRQLVTWPNETDDEASFNQKVLVSEDSAGAFYAQIIPAASGAPAELRPLNPAYVAPVPGPLNRPIAYEYRVGSTKIRIPAEEMLARQLPHPLNPWQGLAPLAVALGVVDSDNASTDYVRAFFNNAGIISGILKVQGEITQQEANEIRDKWRAQFARFWGRQHDVAVLDDRIGYTPMGSKLNELDNELLRLLDETRICMVFGVPPLLIYSLIGLQRATYNNLPAAQQGFWDNTMVPWFTAHGRWMTRALLTRYEPERLVRAGQIRCRYDFAAVPALQDSTDGKHARARAVFEAGAATLNEYRAAVDLAPDPAGDYYLRKVAYVATKQGSDIADIPAGQGTTGSGDLNAQAVQAARAVLASTGTPPNE